MKENNKRVIKQTQKAEKLISEKNIHDETINTLTTIYPGSFLLPDYTLQSFNNSIEEIKTWNAINALTKELKNHLKKLPTQNSKSKAVSLKIDDIANILNSNENEYAFNKDSYNLISKGNKEYELSLPLVEPKLFNISYKKNDDQRYNSSQKLFINLVAKRNVNSNKDNDYKDISLKSNQLQIIFDHPIEDTRLYYFYQRPFKVELKKEIRSSTDSINNLLNILARKKNKDVEHIKKQLKESDKELLKEFKAIVCYDNMKTFLTNNKLDTLNCQRIIDLIIKGCEEQRKNGLSTKRKDSSSVMFQKLQQNIDKIFKKLDQHNLSDIKPMISEDSLSLEEINYIPNIEKQFDRIYPKYFNASHDNKLILEKDEDEDQYQEPKVIDITNSSASKNNIPINQENVEGIEVYNDIDNNNSNKDLQNNDNSNQEINPNDFLQS